MSFAKHASQRCDPARGMRETMSLADRPASDSSLVWFSGVMATGIVALALRDAGLVAVADRWGIEPERELRQTPAERVA